MFLRRFTDFVLQSRVQAMAVAFLTAFIPVIGSISALIATLVTLRKGAVEGALVFIAATLPYILTYFASSNPSELLAFGMLGMMIAGNVVTWFFAVLLRQYSNWNITLEIAALVGLISIALLHLIYPNIQSWWAAQLGAYFTKTAETLAAMGPTGESHMLPKDAQLQIIATAKRYATGFVVASVLFNALLQLAMGRWWQAVMFNPGGLRVELHQIRLSHLSGIIFLIGMMLAYWGNEIALDVMPILYGVFFIAGLSLLHYLIGAIRKNNWLWLIAAYAGIIWLFPLSFILISIIALLDTWADFRKRFNLLKR